MKVFGTLNMTRSNIRILNMADQNEDAVRAIAKLRQDIINCKKPDIRAVMYKSYTLYGGRFLNTVKMHTHTQ